MALLLTKQRVSTRKAKPTADRSRRSNPEDNQFSAPFSVSFPKQIIGFPDRLETTLRYTERYTLSGSATPATQNWVGNSAFDPNSSGVGHQPSFFDSFSGVYSRYYVKEFKIELQIVNTNSSIGLYCVLGYSDQDMSSNSVDLLSEAKYAKSFTLAPSGSGNSSKTISLPWMSTSQLMGQKLTEPDPNMYALTTSNPVDFAWIYFRATSLDTATTVSGYYKAIIHQRVIFKDLLPQVSS